MPPVGGIKRSLERAAAPVSAKLERQKTDYRLAPDEWKSGENMWLLALVGPPKALPALRKQLDEEVFKGRQVWRTAWATTETLSA